MSVLVASNALLLDRASSLRSLLNSGVFLRLFTGPPVISPADVLADFSEATFAGYAGEDLAGDFGAPSKIQDGAYRINSVAKTFTCSGAPFETVLGCYLDNGTDVLFSSLFDSPILVANGTSFQVSISPQDWALVIV